MRKTSIGGEALIEGVLMRGPKSNAAAYRKPDGEIVVEKKAYTPIAKRYKVLNIPLVRGSVNLIESLVIGVKAIMRSADFVDIEEEEPTKFDEFLERVFGDKLKTVVVYFSVVLAVILGVGIFMIIPNLIASLFSLVGINSNIILNLIEGLIRVIVFFSYIILISKMDDIKRVFEYHGAEHKTIHAYEHEEELKYENIKKYKTLHPRCGTAFLFLVMVISVIVFSLTGWNSIIVNILFRLLLIPLVAGISYEILKLAGKKDNLLMKIVSYPGMFLQNYTTREPDKEQIEVAVKAMESVLEDIDEEEDVVE